MLNYSDQLKSSLSVPKTRCTAARIISRRGFVVADAFTATVNRVARPGFASVKPHRRNSAQAFVYDCDSVADVKLGDHNWTPPQGDVPFANLHVFAEEELPDEGTIQHALDAFTSMVKGVTGLDIQLKSPQRAAPFDSQRDRLPDNVDQQHLVAG